MKKFSLFLPFVIFGVTACDLQPKISSLPDTVGEFISARYPALLADPMAESDIYNSAATDYGVYASPELYGTSNVDEYVMYSSVDDYIVPPQESPEQDVAETVDDTDTDEFASDDVLVVPEQQSTVPEENADNKSNDDDIAWDTNSSPDDTLNVPMYGGDIYTEITVVHGDTLYMVGKKYSMTVDEVASLNNLSEPYRLSVGQKLRVRTPAEKVVTDASKVPEQRVATKKPNVKTTAKPVAKAAPVHNTTTRVAISEITVAPGDTLYSLSRKYSVPVNDLAVMNGLNVPFGLYAGQKLKVPDLSTAPVRSATTSATKTAKADAKSPKQVAKQNTQTNKAVAKTPEKKETISKTKTTTEKAVNKKPVITARSASKFSWPVRGKILSNYGAKNGGLFNDGINIGANQGVTVAAAENGVVAYAGNEVKGMGNLVIVQHSDGWMTVYAHMDSMSVRRGTRVSVGQKIGTVGKTGKVDKPQLHFEIRKGTKAYNPIQYLKK